MRERWLGATGLRVPEIAVEGELDLPAHTLVLDAVDLVAFQEAFKQGRPVAVRAATPEGVRAALSRPEVSCVLVPPGSRELLAIDLPSLTYG